MRYAKGMAGLVTKLGMRLVTVSIGRDFEWQGGVTQEEQRQLMKLMEGFADRFALKVKEHEEQERNSANQQETIATDGRPIDPPSDDGITATEHTPKRRRHS